MSTTSVAHQPGRMVDLLATTTPLPSVPVAATAWPGPGSTSSCT